MAMLPSSIESPIAPRHLRYGEFMPVHVPLREKHEGALTQCPEHQGDECPADPEHGQKHQRGIETTHEPHGRPEARCPHGQDARPHRLMNRGGVALDVFAGHNVAPPTSPSSPISTTPPPRRPALLKNPTLPSRILLNGLSMRLPT